MAKQRTFSIIYISCIALFFSTLPFSILIKNETLCITLQILSKIIGIILFLHYEKKDLLKHAKTTKVKKSDLMYLPFILICFSNIIIALINKNIINTNINYFYLFLSLFSCILTSIIEELIFRYLIEFELLKHNSPIKSILYSSLIFGGIHLLNINSIASIPYVLIQIIYML